MIYGALIGLVLQTVHYVLTGTSQAMEYCSVDSAGVIRLKKAIAPKSGLTFQVWLHILIFILKCPVWGNFTLLMKVINMQIAATVMREIYRYYFASHIQEKQLTKNILYKKGELILYKFATIWYINHCLHSPPTNPCPPKHSLSHVTHSPTHTQPAYTHKHGLQP